MIVYIAGKMTGLEDLGRVAFDRAENQLTGLGYQVLNPAWLGNGLPKEAYMPICLSMIQQAQVLVLLDGWESSPGARLERAFAEYQDMPVYSLGELVEREKKLAQALLAEDVNAVERVRSGLRHCLYGEDGGKGCDGCPYRHKRCEQELHKEALLALQQSDRRERKLEKTADRLADELAEAKRQLNAALGELKNAAWHSEVCCGCKHYGVPVEDSPACAECDCECSQCKNPCPCASCEEASNWEWKGA